MSDDRQEPETSSQDTNINEMIWKKTKDEKYLPFTDVTELAREMDKKTLDKA